MVGDEEKERKLRGIHENLIGGCHFGQNSTLRKITDRLWWPTVTNDVKQYVRSCLACQRSNPDNKPAPATLHPIPVKGLFHRWGIDLIGPLQTTEGGFRYVAVATEYLSKWAEVAPLSNKSADSVHEFLLSLIYRFGACDVIIHDQGREFCNSLVSGLLDKVGVDQATTSAYHPQSNGLTEISIYFYYI